MTGWAAADPDGIRTYVSVLPEELFGPARMDAIGMIARYQDIEVLLAWAEALVEQVPDPRLRAKIFRKTARNAARREPERTGRWLAAWALLFALYSVPQLECPIPRVS